MYLISGPLMVMNPHACPTLDHFEHGVSFAMQRIVSAAFQGWWFSRRRLSRWPPCTKTRMAGLKPRCVAESIIYLQVAYILHYYVVCTPQLPIPLNQEFAVID